MQDLGFMVDLAKVEQMARDAGAMRADGSVVYGQLLSYIYGTGAVNDQQSGTSADTVAIAQMLNGLDGGNSGVLSIADVQKVLHQSGVTVGRDRVEELAGAAGAEDAGTGDIEYAKFVQYIHQNGGLTFGGALAAASVDLQDLNTRLNQLDTAGTGVTTAAAISKTLRRHMQVDIKAEKISEVAGQHDALLPDGSVLFSELLKTLAEKGGLSVHGELLGSPLDASEVRTDLQALDLNGSGVLNAGEVGRALAAKGVMISAGRLRALAEHAGATTADGGLVWGTLLEYIDQNGGIARDGSKLLGASIDVGAAERAIMATSKRLGRSGGMRAGDLSDAFRAVDADIDAARAEVLARTAGAIKANGEIDAGKVAEFLHKNGGVTKTGGIRHIRAAFSARAKDGVNDESSRFTSAVGLGAPTVDGELIALRLEEGAAGAAGGTLDATSVAAALQGLGAAVSAKTVQGWAQSAGALGADGAIDAAKLGQFLQSNGGVSFAGRLTGAAIDSGLLERALEAEAGAAGGQDLKSGTMDATHTANALRRVGSQIDLRGVVDLAKELGVLNRDGRIRWREMKQAVDSKGGMGYGGALLGAPVDPDALKARLVAFAAEAGLDPGPGLALPEDDIATILQQLGVQVDARTLRSIAEAHGVVSELDGAIDVERFVEQLDGGAMGGALRAASNEFTGKLAAMTERVAAGRSADGESNVLSADVAAALAADVLSNPAEGIGAGATKLDPDTIRAAIKKVNAEAAQRGEAPVVDAELQDAMVSAAPATAAQLLSKFPGDSHAVLAVLTAGTAEITSSKPSKGGKGEAAADSGFGGGAQGVDMGRGARQIGELMSCTVVVLRANPAHNRVPLSLTYFVRRAASKRSRQGHRQPAWSAHAAEAHGRTRPLCVLRQLDCHGRHFRRRAGAAEAPHKGSEDARRRLAIWARPRAQGAAHSVEGRWRGAVRGARAAAAAAPSRRAHPLRGASPFPPRGQDRARASDEGRRRRYLYQLAARARRECRKSEDLRRRLAHLAHSEAREEEEEQGEPRRAALRGRRRHRRYGVRRYGWRRPGRAGRDAGGGVDEAL